MSGVLNLTRKNGIKRIPTMYSVFPAILSNSIKKGFPKTTKWKPSSVVRNIKPNKKRLLRPLKTKAKNHKPVKLTAKKRSVLSHK